MPNDKMWILTDVSPYVTGPAGVHGVLPQARIALSEVASWAGLDPVVPPTVEALEPEGLDSGGVLALFTIGETPFSDRQRQAIAAGWRAGRLKVMGIHSATDACRRWDDYGPLLGARFDGHPWTQTFDVEVVDASHPATSMLADRFPWHDEVYLFSDLDPAAHVLLRVAEGALDMSVPEAKTPPAGFPLAWSIGRDGGASEGGSTFYTALGHFPGAWENPLYLRHLTGGLAWLLGGGS